MPPPRTRFWPIAFATTLLFPAVAAAQRQMERLGRGVVAVHQGEGKVFVGWRLLGTDGDAVAFNVYRAANGGRPVKVNTSPITAASNFVDTQADLTKSLSYSVRPVLKGRKQEASKPFTLPANAPARQYISIPLRTPEGYSPNDASVGDLDGDGEYEIVLHQVGRGRDNSQPGVTTEPILEAYKLNGTFLWSINLGKNIREGAHYTQFMVYDLDGDGRAEVACKTAVMRPDLSAALLGRRQVERYANNAHRLLAVGWRERFARADQQRQNQRHGLRQAGGCNRLRQCHRDQHRNE